MFSGHLGARTAAAGVISCALLVSGVSAQAPPGIPDDSREGWLALLHYWSDDGEWLSEVKDTSFFLDAEGPRNPEREWSTDRRAFLAPADA